MTPLVAASAGFSLADLMTLACIVGLALFGAGRGLFLATVVGLVALVAFVCGMLFGPPLATMLESFDCPAAFALPAAYVATCAVVVAAARVAVGGALQEDDMRFAPMIDKIGGLLAGAWAGVMLAGAVQVGWSMCELPASVRLDPPRLRFDAGSRALRTFVRAATADGDRRVRLLEGGLCRECDASKPAIPRMRVSDPFDDLNTNGLHDEGEPYLDADGSGSFTTDRWVAIREPTGEGPVDAVGLAERYRLAAWRRIRVLHAPAITSPGDTKATPGGDGVIYRITAEDADGGTLTYSVAPSSEDDSGLQVDVDPATGDVRLREPQFGDSRGRVRFTAIVTDAGGLRDAKPVSVTLVEKTE